MELHRREMGRLDGKVAIVSGGARGEGESEVRRFVVEGAVVVFGDVLDDLGDSWLPSSALPACISPPRRHC